MNFIESIFNEFQKGIKEIMGDIPKEIKSYCIGSGSNFEVHAYITLDKALEIYENKKKQLPLSKRTEKIENGNYIKETFHTLESQSGYTSTFLFPINNIKFYDPNDTLREWTKTLKEQEELREEFIKCFKKK